MQTSPLITFALIVISLSRVLMADTLPPFPAETNSLDRAYNATQVESTRLPGLEMLEAVAEGKSGESIITSAQRAGLGMLAATGLFFDAPSVRAYAMDRIGASGLPEAIEYLKSMTVDRVGPDSTQTIYAASQVALYKALFRQETDPEKQVAFLEHQLMAPTHGAVASWAMSALCNRGSSSSLPEIKKLVKMRYQNLPRGDAQIQFCKDRMEIVNRNPDRVKALASALTIDQTVKDRQLTITHWVIAQLEEIRSTEAYAALDRYAAEIERKYPDTPAANELPESQRLRRIAHEVRVVLSRPGR